MITRTFTVAFEEDGYQRRRAIAFQGGNGFCYVVVQDKVNRRRWIKVPQLRKRFSSWQDAMTYANDCVMIWDACKSPDAPVPTNVPTSG